MEELFVAHRDAALELRTAFESAVWDEARATLDACGSRLARDARCWIRFPVSVRGPSMMIARGAPVRCIETDPDTNARVAMERQAADLLASCVTTAAAAVTEVGVPRSFREEVGDYQGTLDVSFQLAAPASQGGRP